MLAIERPHLDDEDSPRLPDFDKQLTIDEQARVQNQEENAILALLPLNGCACNRLLDLGPQQQKKGCAKTAKWLNIAYSQDNYLFVSSYKLYQGF